MDISGMRGGGKKRCDKLQHNSQSGRATLSNINGRNKWKLITANKEKCFKPQIMCFLSCQCHSQIM